MNIEKHYCQCGCGGEIIIKPHHKWYGIPRYISGHNIYNNINMLYRSKVGKLNTMFGKKQSVESNKKNSEKHKGENNPMYGIKGKMHPAWKGGITTLQIQIRNSIEYFKWRDSIFIRDNFTCQKCGVKKCYLEAHHVKQVAQIIFQHNLKTFESAQKCEDLWNLNNGITLCEKCHDNKEKKKYNFR